MYSGSSSETPLCVCVKLFVQQSTHTMHNSLTCHATPEYLQQDLAANVYACDRPRADGKSVKSTTVARHMADNSSTLKPLATRRISCS